MSKEKKPHDSGAFNKDSEFLKLNHAYESPGEQSPRSDNTCPAPGTKQLGEQENREHALSNISGNSCSEREKLLGWLRCTYRASGEDNMGIPYHRTTRVRILTNRFLYDSWVH